jgi:hypothetical protein
LSAGNNGKMQAFEDQHVQPHQRQGVLRQLDDTEPNFTVDGTSVSNDAAPVGEDNSVDDDVPVAVNVDSDGNDTLENALEGICGLDIVVIVEERRY